MILGVGIDIVEIERVKKAIDNRTERFSARILAPDELVEWEAIITDSRKAEYLAGRFAVKEAVSKAFGSGIGEISFQDIIIYKDGKGKPEVRLDGNAQQIAERMGVSSVWISISHSKDYAVAQAILEKKQP